MSEARLAAGIEVTALLTLARGAGGFGTVLSRGDAESGTVMCLLAERGITRFVVQRMLQKDGSYAWESRESGDSATLAQMLVRAHDRDPDLWVIELDVPSPERFIAEMS